MYLDYWYEPIEESSDEIDPIPVEVLEQEDDDNSSDLLAIKVEIMTEQLM